jgi:hypothetical protein
VLDEPISDEQFAELVSVLESDSITAEQVANAVDAIIENDVTQEQATKLATSAKVLESVDGEQAAEIFDAINIADVSTQEGMAIVAAVQDAPTEVKEAFEEQINVFDGVVDTYVPLGSSVPVSSRRVLIAVTAAMSAMPLPTRKVN